MVTDEEYRELKKRVEELENKMKLMSQQLSTFYMRNDMHITSEGAKQQEQRKHKDVTKYLFKEKQFCKRELVLQCVKEYVKEHPELNAEQLIDVFPDYVQGSLGIVKRVVDAEWYTNAKKRFYFSDENIIHLSDGDYVVCTQWDAGNIGKFLKLAEDLGFEIQPITRKYID